MVRGGGGSGRGWQDASHRRNNVSVEPSYHFCLPSIQDPSGENLPGPPLRSSPHSKSLGDLTPLHP